MNEKETDYIISQLCIADKQGTSMLEKVQADKLLSRQ